MISKNYRRNILALLIFICFLLQSTAMAQTIEEKVQDIHKYVNNLYDESEPGAVILVAKNGKPVFKKAYGVADYEKKIPLTPDHSFAIGSLSKQFSALSVLMLTENSKLSIDDDLTTYFPQVFKFNGIKIHHLLTHSSGIKDLFNIKDWRKDLSVDLSRQQTFNMIINEKLEFQPGERTQYSNSGYYLLGMIVEQVAHMGLNDYIQKNIFTPLQMTKSSFIDDLIETSPTAIGYEKHGKNIVNPGHVSKTRFFAGGSIISTVEDLLKWDEALYGTNLVNKSTLQLFFDPIRLNNGELSTYSCGWEVSEYAGKKILGHGGGINGYVCQVYRIPEEHLYVAILSNIVDRNTKQSVAQTAQQIVNIMMSGNQKDNFVSAITLTEKEAETYTGKYRLPDGSLRQISALNGKVYYHVNDEKKVEIFPESKTTFRGGKASVIRFYFNDKGNIDRFELFTGRGRSIEGIKQN